MEGAGLRLALDPNSHVTGDLIALGSLICLIGSVLLGASVLHERTRASVNEVLSRKVALPRPRSGEEAVALAHAQKMETLGVLAGGVAHDFNNLLHVIRNSLDIAQRQGPEADTRRSLDMIRRSTDQAAALTRQLLAYSRRQPPDLRPIDPNGLVAQVTELLRHSLGERITIETVLGPGVWDVAADTGQLETALLNLAINARDAMSQAGRLTIETANAILDEFSASAPGPRAAGQYVMIAVSDTGAGMAADVAARACEPFFTTKEPGHGTGLGLSQVAGFAQQSGGHVRISSEPGRGTTVRIYLPRSDPLPRALPLARPGPKAGRRLRGALPAARELAPQSGSQTTRDGISAAPLSAVGAGRER
jgi:signal transduction histidine kinase